MRTARHRAEVGTAGAAALVAGLLSVHAAANLRHLRSAPPATDDAARLLRRDATGATPAGPAVSVLIPARDEAARIGGCVRSVLAALDGVDAEVLVLDDGSHDGTGAIALAAAAGDPRLRVLSGAPLPEGWLGKPHACHQLAATARGAVLVFLDADVRVAKDGVARTTALLADLDLVCPYPRQEADGLLPRLVQPLLQWSWLTFLPLRLAERSPRPSLTAANGQLLACSAPAYRAAGGHEAVRAEVVEDVALARAFKRVGLRATVVDGTDVATCRMYGSGSELVEGYTKSLAAAFGSPGGAAMAMALLTWLYVLPFAVLLRGLRRRDGAAIVAGAAGYLGGVASRLVAARRFGQGLGDAPAHPASILVLTWLTARSWRRRRAGTATWKGRPVTMAGSPPGGRGDG